MSHSPTFPQQSSTKAQRASSVSPLHHSGSTTMNASFRAENMDKSLFNLYQKLLELNLSIGEMVGALNISLSNYQLEIKTIFDLECFILSAEEWEAEYE